MTAREVLARIRECGGDTLRQTGSHVRVVCRCGKWKGSVPFHKGHDINTGTLRNIQKQLAPCFGNGWLLG